MQGRNVLIERQVIDNFDLPTDKLSQRCKYAITVHAVWLNTSSKRH